MRPRKEHFLRGVAKRDIYYGEGYDTLWRFVSYWHQIEEIRRTKPGRVLEIGVGNGFVSRYLRERGFNVVTLDFNPMLQSDVLGSITAIPFADQSFDVVSACEVLEHLPQGSVMDALREMRRVTSQAAVLSLPNRRRAWPVQVPVPKLGWRRWIIELGAPRDRPLDPEQHGWEIGHGGISAGDVREWVCAAGFRVERDYRPFHNPGHHFFVLRVR